MHDLRDPSQGMHPLACGVSLLIRWKHRDFEALLDDISQSPACNKASDAQEPLEDIWRHAVLPYPLVLKHQLSQLQWNNPTACVERCCMAIAGQAYVRQELKDASPYPRFVELRLRGAVN